MIEIDGSLGEGGGQIIRTALSLSGLLGVPFRIYNVRKKRTKRGLRAQHVAAVRALEEISNARVKGAAVGSDYLEFEPGKVTGGPFSFDIGTAGATMLVLQTLLPPLLFARNASRIVLKGGTHVPLSPPFHFIGEVFLPLLSGMGAEVSVYLGAYGFYPRGGGEVEVYVKPCKRTLKAISLNKARMEGSVTGMSAVARLPLSIAERQRDAALALLHEHNVDGEISVVSVPSSGPGTFVFLKAGNSVCPAGFSSVGIRGKRAEAVGMEAASELVDYRSRAGCLDPHLADQIVLYLAVAEGESHITTTAVSQHLVTNLQVIRKFVNVEWDVRGEIGSPGEITVRPPPLSLR